MTDISLRLPQLRKDQYAIAAHPAKVKNVVAGRRYGKTFFGGDVSVVTAANGGRVAWNVPTYKNGRPLWRLVEILVSPLKKAGLVSVNKSDRVVEFTYNRGLLSLFSMDSPDSILGEHFNLVVNDEAARIKEEAYYGAILPTVADVNGDIINITTPKGKNWVFREYLRGLRQDKEAASFKAPSSMNPNPHIQAAMKKAREIVGERTYLQEWEAEFLDNEGTVFRDISACLNAPLDDIPAAHIGHTIVAGIDWGKSVDWTVCSVFCVACRRELALKRMRGLDYKAQRRIIYELCRYWNVVYIEAEANAMGQPIIDELRAGDEYPLKDILIVSPLDRPQYAWIYHQYGAYDGPYNNVYDPTLPDCLPYNPNLCRGGRVHTVENPLAIPADLWLTGEYAPGLNIHPFTTTNTSKAKIIESLVLAFERTEAQWLPDPVAKGELESFEIDVNPVTGRVTYSAPDGEHDDTVISRALAWYAANTPASRIVNHYKLLSEEVVLPDAYPIPTLESAFDRILNGYR